MFCHSRPQLHNTFEKLQGSTPDRSQLCVVGCIVYVHIAQDKQTKLQLKLQRCVFVGSSDVSKLYHCYGLVIQQIISTNDVTFFENVLCHFHDTHKFMDIFSGFDIKEETFDRLLQHEDDNSEVD